MHRWETPLGWLDCLSNTICYSFYPKIVIYNVRHGYHCFGWSAGRWHFEFKSEFKIEFKTKHTIRRLPSHADNLHTADDDNRLDSDDDVHGWGWSCKSP